MARIIPWNLPPVKGGSIGGYTPQPTPTPSSSDPYDLDSMVVAADFGISVTNDGTYHSSVLPAVNISGVVINDTSAVSSVIATVKVTAGNIVAVRNDSTTLTITVSEDQDYDVDISSIMSPVGGSSYGETALSTWDSASRYFVSIDASTTSTITLETITVYNSNGVPLQQWEATP